MATTSLCVLLLFFVGPQFISQLPNTVYAEPSIENSFSRAFNATRNVTSGWWNNTKNFINPNSRGASGSNSRPTYSFNASRIATITRGFSNHLLNSTTDSVSPKNGTSGIRHKIQQGWRKFRNFFSRRTTPSPPIAWNQVPYNRPYPVGYLHDSRSRREADPCKPGKSQATKEMCK